MHKIQVECAALIISALVKQIRFHASRDVQRGMVCTFYTLCLLAYLPFSIATLLLSPFRSAIGTIIFCLIVFNTLLALEQFQHIVMSVLGCYPQWSYAISVCLVSINAFLGQQHLDHLFMSIPGCNCQWSRSIPRCPINKDVFLAQQQIHSRAVTSPFLAARNSPEPDFILGIVDFVQIAPLFAVLIRDSHATQPGRRIEKLPEPSPS